jgi:hypothetical protein
MSNNSLNREMFEFFKNMNLFDDRDTYVYFDKIMKKNFCIVDYPIDANPYFENLIVKFKIKGLFYKNNKILKKVKEILKSYKKLSKINDDYEIKDIYKKKNYRVLNLQSLVHGTEYLLIFKLFKNNYFILFPEYLIRDIDDYKIEYTFSNYF